MDFSARLEGDVKVVTVTGHLETNCVSEFRDKFNEETDSHDKVVLDCSGMDYLDSSGLASLVSIYKHLAARDSKLVISGLSDTVLRVIQFTKLDKVFTLAPTMEEALDLLKS